MKQLLILTLVVCLPLCAAQRRYSISGTVSGASAVTVKLSGKATKSTITAANGFYQFTNLVKGTYTVTPVKAGYTFNPPSRTFAAGGPLTTITQINFAGTSTTPPPQPHSVTLSWTASTSPSIQGYKVYRAATNGGPYAQIATGITTTSYLDQAVSAGQTYYYVTTAYNVDGESPYSNQAVAVVPTP